MTALHLVMMKPGIMYEGDTVQLERKSASNRVEEAVKRGGGVGINSVAFVHSEPRNMTMMMTGVVLR